MEADYGGCWCRLYSTKVGRDDAIWKRDDRAEENWRASPVREAYF